MLELVDNHFSITCEVDSQGVRWYLTRESGRFPTQYCCPWDDEVRSVRRSAYFVVKVREHPCQEEGCFTWVFVAELCSDRVQGFVGDILPRLIRWMPCDGGFRCDNSTMFMRYVSFWLKSAFSCSVGCTYVDEGSCSCCVRGVRDKDWVFAYSYRGLYSCGHDHWWTEVTDGIETSCSDSGERFCCCCYFNG
jgi:hypothetical protein